jgi:hypothetical protein
MSATREPDGESYNGWASVCLLPWLVLVDLIFCA